MVLNGLNMAFLGLGMNNVLLEAAGERGAATTVDLVAFKAVQLLDKSDSGPAHRKGCRCKAIRLENVGADHAQADDLLAERIGAQGVVDVVAAHRVPGC